MEQRLFGSNLDIEAARLQEKLPEGAKLAIV